MSSASPSDREDPASDDLSVTGLEGLLVRAGALEAAWRALDEGKPDALESVQRLLHSIAGFTRKYDVAEIRDVILAAELASPSELPAALERLIGLLHEFASRARTRKLEILIIDDDPDFASLLRIRLSEPNREIVVAGSVGEADRILARRSPSLILLDLHLPDSDGRNLLLRVREDPRTGTIPIIMMTADRNPEPQGECLGLGADAYFEKPVDLEVLATAVSARLLRTAELSRASHRDPLTGLLNRDALEIEFDSAQKNAAATGAPIAVAILDLDHFKRVNDSHGHGVGDEVLRRTAGLLRHVFRRSDSVCRWGGEELVVLFPGTDEAGGVAAMETALAAFRSERFETERGRSFYVTFSAGVALVPDDATLEQAIAEADRCLYFAKTAGRNRVVSRRDAAPAPTIHGSS